MRIVALAPPQSREMSDAEIVRQAAKVLSDPRAWAVVGQADLDPQARRRVCARAVGLLEEALETV
jgi:hypothetical protein